ncbi:MAG: helix-turn-helix domain-containing protein, partial [Haloechinothrix sp.]
WDTELVDRWLNETRGKRLLILDVLARVRGPVPAGAQIYDADYRAMSRIKAIADEYEVPALAVHHTRKMASADFLNEVSGSNGLAGASDAVLVLKRMRGEADAELHITGRDLVESEWALNFEASLGSWHRLERPAAEYKLSDTRSAILVYLREHGSATPKQVADALDITPATARQTLRRMTEDGQMDTDGRGVYIPVTPVTPVTSAGQRRDSAQIGLSLPDVDGHMRQEDT